MTMKIETSILSDLWQQYSHINNICTIALKTSIKELQPLYNKKLTGEVSLVFTNDLHIQELNAQWRNKNKATNVLSFPSKNLIIGEAPFKIWGDIIFAYETIENEALTQNKLFVDHFSHIFIHGLLHLLGFNHKKENEAEQMENLECKILNILNIKNPYNSY